MNKVGLPKGMRDFSPEIMAKRNYIFDTIKAAFRLHGFEQIETPAMENRETLTGKYGEEGDRLIFNVLNSGEYLNKANQGAINESNSSKLTSSIAEKALKYDLTVPFARYVVQHQNEISFPFKRFQIQPVWRADRPQKGRYREFYQCDADIIGSDSLWNEVDLIQLFDEVLSNLGLNDFSIKINHRKILSGIAELIGKPEMLIPITVAIDKLDKIGFEKVMEELESKGLSQKELDLIKPLFDLGGGNTQVLSDLKKLLASSTTALEGIKEVEFLLNSTKDLGLKKAKLELDVTLARGLDYYTGAIFEVVSNEVQMGSICGGGRYADLTGIFGLKNLSGVGISFGADRIYDVMENLDLFPNEIENSVEVLLVNFGENVASFAYQTAKQLRELGVIADYYPDPAKLKKQMKYADDKHIPYVLLLGEEEMNEKKYTLKEMKSGEQSTIGLEEVVKKIHP